MRKNANGRKERCAFITVAAVLLVSFVFLSGRWERERDWPNLTLTNEAIGTTFTKERDEYGMLGKTTGLNLPAGTYRLQWQIDCDAENVLQIACANDAAIEPAEFAVSPNEWGEGTFTLREAAASVTIQPIFRNGETMTIYNLRLSSPRYRDDAFSLSLLIILAAVLLIAWECGRLTESKLQALVIICTAAAFASIPALQADTVGGNDTIYHFARIMNLVDGMSAGQFPVRVGGYAYNGYGAAMSVFYPDLFLYPSALLIMFGTSATYAVNTYLISMNVLAALTMAYAASRMFRDRNIGLAAAVIYVTAPGRLYHLYGWLMAGTVAAEAALPLFILGVYEVLDGDATCWQTMVLGAMLIFFNHMLSTLICLGFALIAMLLHLPGWIRQREWARPLALCKAAICCVLLGLPVIVPLIGYRMDGITTMPEPWLPKNTALELSELLTRRDYLDLLPAAFGALFLWQTLGHTAQSEQERLGRRCLVAALCTALMTTRYFPWAHLSILTRGLSDVIQFPMRLLFLTLPMLALCGAFAVMQLVGERRDGALALLLIACVLGSGGYVRELAEKKGKMAFGTITTPLLDYREYLYGGTRPKATSSKQPEVEGVLLTGYEKHGLSIRADALAESDGQIIFPLFGFDGLHVTLDGQEIPWTRGKNNRLTVNLSAGDSGILRVRFVQKVSWRIADAVAIITLVSLCLNARHKRQKRRESMGRNCAIS